MPIEPARQLVHAASQDPVHAPTLQQAAEAFVRAMDGADPDDQRQALEIAAEGLVAPDLFAVGFVSTVLGATFERGADPAPVAPTMVSCLRQLIEGAEAFHDRVRPGLSDEDAGDPEAFDRAAEAASDTREAAGWVGLQQYWRGGIALMSRHPASRRALSELAPKLLAMVEVHEGAHWLAQMALVLDDEPFLVLEPSTGLGIEARVSGVADNFQLHMLLMERFPRPDGVPPRITGEAAAVARGDGPQVLEEGIAGTWNLYEWSALGATGELPEGFDQTSTAHWIWNEGRVADIPMFEGRRVVLLGPPAYARSWGVSRQFQSLPASLEVVRELSPEEVAEQLERIRRAGATGGP